MYFDYYSFFLDSFLVQEDGSIQVSVKAERSKPFLLGPMEIDIDGSLIIRAFSDETCVGRGYLIGDGFRDSDDSIGFLPSKTYLVDIIPEDADYDFKQDNDYEFEIEPISMWMIEK